MKIIVISPHVNARQSISEIAQKTNPTWQVSQFDASLSQVGGLIDNTHPHVAVLEGLCDTPALLANVERISTQYPQLELIVCTKEHASADYLMAAMRAGVRDVLAMPVDGPIFEQTLSRIELKLGLRSDQKQAQVLTFVSCKGGSGATFLATNLSHYLAAQGKKTLLIDLNLQFGEALLTIHDQKAETDISHVERNFARLDGVLLSASTVKVTPNFEVLAAPEDPNSSLSVSADHLEKILNIAGGLYDFVVMDINKNLDELSVKALDHSDNIYLVVQALLPYARNVHRMLAMFRELGYSNDKLELVVNRYIKGGEISLDDLQENTGIKRVRGIPNSYKDVTKSINYGTPLASIAKSSQTMKAIEDMGNQLLPRSSTTNHSGGFLSRLLQK